MSAEASVSRQVRERKAGILRLEINPISRQRRSSVEFRTPSETDVISPQFSGDHLSVTFAPEERSMCSDSSGRVIVPLASPSSISSAGQKIMESDHLPAPEADGAGSEDDDYSASVSAVMMRRASTRKSRKRRASSPFNADLESLYNPNRRRSSVFTTSSGETVISVDETTGSEEMYELLKLHKEVLSAVRTQPWPMRRKLRLVHLAHSYVKQHEGALQQRLAQSRNTRDVLKRYRLMANKKWQHFRREMANLTKYLTPWEIRIKQIESQFGSVVASYFTFLRWLLWINLVIGALLVTFVVIPEVLTADWEVSGDRKKMLKEDEKYSSTLVTLVNFEGVLKYSPLFYGYYSNTNGTSGYRLPLAYFVVGVVVYVYSFIATLRKMAANSRISKMSEKEDECIFTWKIFTGWDYMIGNPETAQNRVSSLVLGFKEALLEEAEKKRDDRNWKIIVCRVFVNIVVLILLGISATAVVWVVQRSIELGNDASWWRKNEINVAMALISNIFPFFFDFLGLLEYYHPRKQLRVQLFRIMLLNLLNLYALTISLFDKISDMTKDLQSLKLEVGIVNTTTSTLLPTITPLIELITSKITTDNPFINFNTTDCEDSPQFNCTDVGPSITTTIAALLLFSPSQSIADYNFTQQDLSTNQPVLMFDLTNSSIMNNTFFLKYHNESLNLLELYNNYKSENRDTNDADFINDFFVNRTYDENFYQALIAVLQNTNFLDQVKDTLDKDGGFVEDNLLDFVNETVTDMYTGGLNLSDNQALEEIPGYAKLIQERTFAASPRLVEYSLPVRRKLRRLCWETSFGQEIVKLTITDLVVTVITTIIFDFFRALFVRYLNNCWCWDLEKKWPQYADFKIAENILHLVNNQGLVWMGMFFSPGLVIINLAKLVIMMYLRSWTVLTCNVPHEIVFRASRSNNFYFALLLTMLFLCVLPVGYAIVWVEPSWHCGPFSGYRTISEIFTEFLHKIIPKKFHLVLDYMASPGIVIPLLVLLILIIYYLLSLSNALREANQDLKIQLRKERTEERRKMFQIADKRYKNSVSFDKSPYGKWKKLFSTMAVVKQPSQDACPQAPPEHQVKDRGNKSDKVENKKREIMAKIMKNAFGMQSGATEDDCTDTELHDSLPYDSTEKRPSVLTPSKIKVSTTKQDSPPKYNEIEKHSKKSKSKNRQSSDVSIPTITISKTESAECILDKKKNEDVVSEDKPPEVAAVVQNRTLIGRFFKSKPKENLKVDDSPKSQGEKSSSQDKRKAFFKRSTKATVDDNILEEVKDGSDNLSQGSDKTIQNDTDVSSKTTVELVKSKISENEEKKSNTTKTESSSGYKE